MVCDCVNVTVCKCVTMGTTLPAIMCGQPQMRAVKSTKPQSSGPELLVPIWGAGVSGLSPALPSHLVSSIDPLGEALVASE